MLNGLLGQPAKREAIFSPPGTVRKASFMAWGIWSLSVPSKARTSMRSQFRKDKEIVLPRTPIGNCFFRSACVCLMISRSSFPNQCVLICGLIIYSGTTGRYGAYGTWGEGYFNFEFLLKANQNLEHFLGNTIFLQFLSKISFKVKIGNGTRFLSEVEILELYLSWRRKYHGTQKSQKTISRNVIWRTSLKCRFSLWHRLESNRFIDVIDALELHVLRHVTYEVIP